MNYFTQENGRDIEYNYICIDSLNNRVILKNNSLRFELRFKHLLDNLLLENLVSYMLVNLYIKENDLKELFNIDFDVNQIIKCSDTDYEKIYIKLKKQMDGDIRLKYLVSHINGTFDGTLTINSFNIEENNGNLIQIMNNILGEVIYLNDLNDSELENYLNKNILSEDFLFTKNKILFYNNMNKRIFGENLCLYFKNYFLRFQNLKSNLM